ncbi:MAG: hypothetical protein PHI05_03535 [Bacilli bacterium]|nr:hypothetical protein [Bacilli bacterium]MDD4547793.1 hypothetical protein [Bacilli bacterium]
MKSKIKLLMVLVMTVLLTGCSATYDIIIKANDEVFETINLSFKNEELGETKKEINAYLDEQIKSYKRILVYQEFDFEKKVGKENSYVTITRTYPNLDEYKESVFVKNLFQNVTVTNNKYYTEIQTVGDYYYDYIYGSDSDEIAPKDKNNVGNVEVSVRLENQLVDTNADLKNETKNIYTWVITPDDDFKSIYIRSDDKLRYDVIFELFIMNNIGIVVLIGITLVTLLILVSTFLIKRAQINKI